MRSQSGGYGDRSTPSRPVLAQKILQQSREAESALSDALVSQVNDFNALVSSLLDGVVVFRNHGRVPPVVTNIRMRVKPLASALTVRSTRLTVG